MLQPAVLLALVALAVVVPFLWLGIPSGHDFDFHLFSWLEVHSQWKLGVLYPRWAGLAHWGYGEARFLFYPPASWTLGALLGTLFPWKLSPALYIWIVLTASGLSLFAVARRWLPPRDALFAAAFYAANPYHLLVVYWRSAYAELLAGALLPLLLLLVLNLDAGGRRVMLLLSLVIAAVWLTNAPSAVMATYSLALLLAVVAWLHKSFRILLAGSAALALGLLLAAFYVLPAAYESSWVNIAEVLSPGVRPQDNFLFTIIADPDHNRFNLLVSTIAAAEIALLAVCSAVAFPRLRRLPLLCWALTAWAAVSILLMFPATLPLWSHLPKLRFVQLPWRWLLCLNVPLALFVACATRRWIARAGVCLALLLVIAAGWHRIQSPWWDNAGDIWQMRDAMSSGEGYEGTDEYVPAGADAYEIRKDIPRVAFESGAHGRIQVSEWKPDKKSFMVTATAPAQVILRLFYYPAWRAQVNGRPVEIAATETTGQLTLPVPAGQSLVTILFTRTRDRTAGAVISLLALALLLALFWWDGGYRRHLEAA